MLELVSHACTIRAHPDLHVATYRRSAKPHPAPGKCRAAAAAALTASHCSAVAVALAVAAGLGRLPTADHAGGPPHPTGGPSAARAFEL